MTLLTLPFNEVGRADVAQVGGKGANLGELTQAGFCVPPGFCVTTRAFRAFIAKERQAIDARLVALEPTDLEQLRRTGHAVRTILEKLPLPPEVEDAVVTAWQELGETRAYAVRSSATAEDLPYASFAGQQDTYLNVKGRDALLESVKHCFISLFTDRAILYRAQNGIAPHEVALSAVVQRMVEPEVSGILFTADPVSNNRHIVSIDASLGLGEALVSGIVTADLYQVDKRTHRITKRQIADKHVAVRSLAAGGTEQVALGDAERTAAALNDDQVLELTELGSRIEAHYGKPQDVEWALLGSTFYITQARPITSLYPLPRPEPTDNALHAYVSFSHLQVMTDAIPPLALSLFRVVFPVGHAHDELESTLIKTAGGRIYLDSAPVLRQPLARRAFLRAFKNIDQLAAGAFAELAERPSLQARGERFNPLRLLPTLRPSIIKLLRMLFWGRPEGVTGDTLRFMDSYLGAVKAKLTGATTVPSQLELAVAELRHAFAPIATWAPYLVAGEVAGALLKILLSRRDLSALERGLLGNVTTEMNLSVGDLGDAARASKALWHYLSRQDVDAKARLEGAANFPGGEAFLQAWSSFIERYGARGPSEIDLSRPRWSEDSGSLLQMVLGAGGQSASGAHRARYLALSRENETATAATIKAAYRGPLGWARGPLVRRLLRVSRHLKPLREHHKFFLVRLFALIKPTLLGAGQKLAAEGRLAAATDVWFLTFPELLEVVSEPGKDVSALVEERQSDFRHAQTLTPPCVMTSDGEIPAVRLETAGTPAGALVGSPVSAGVVEGVAKVVLDPAQEMLRPGEILVAPFTDPGWTPLFVSAVGLITEVGGLMTHGSVIARELGLPAVVGVVDATKRIRTGQRVRVDGNAGYVEILDDAGTKATTPTTTVAA